MLRGTEWAATGKVTIPIPADWPAPVKAQQAGKTAESKPAQPLKKAGE
jgi:hypothetical protein